MSLEHHWAKKDWSFIRITLILYFIVIFLPFNYYYMKESFESIQNDAQTLSKITQISIDVQKVKNADKNQQEVLLQSIDDSLLYVNNTFMQYTPNKDYVALFRTDEMFVEINNQFKDIQTSATNSNIDRMVKQMQDLSKTVAEMAKYKNEDILDRLFLSLAFTMISIITLVFLTRVYIKLQIKKHSIKDPVTGLNNKKFFDIALKEFILLSTRQQHKLSIVTVKIQNYEELQNSIDKTDFQKNLIEFSKAYNDVFRRSDIVCRIEDDCFASITPDDNEENVQKLSLRLIEQLELLKLEYKLKIQVGFATYSDQVGTLFLQEATNKMDNSKVIIVGDAS